MLHFPWLTVSLAYIITKCTKWHHPLWVAMVTDVNQTCSQVRVLHPKKTNFRISAVLSWSVTTNLLYFPFPICPFLLLTHDCQLEKVAFVLLLNCSQVDPSPAFYWFLPKTHNLSNNITNWNEIDNCCMVAESSRHWSRVPHIPWKTDTHTAHKDNL